MVVVGVVLVVVVVGLLVPVALVDVVLRVWP